MILGGDLAGDTGDTGDLAGDTGDTGDLAGDTGSGEKIVDADGDQSAG